MSEHDQTTPPSNDEQGISAKDEAETRSLESERDGFETLTPETSSNAIGQQIGPYRILEALGEGGMGTVYLAEQREPVRRRVALKIIKVGMDTGQVIARFEAERQALAMMDHASIAKVFDAGTTDTGRPFFVMELVEGQPITNFCDDHKLGIDQRLQIFRQVCNAVQHAHQKGVIHRDLKPSNVLVTIQDDKPVPKVIDFGLAKATGQQLTEKTMFTAQGQVLGTLEYMSPEQANLNDLDVDTRSDIYSLGVILYELLTGSTPLTRESLKRAAFMEILKRIKEEEPERPSSRLSHASDTLQSISSVRQIEPRKLSSLMKGELDWVVMKSLEKDRTRRYETANGFAVDIQRYLNDEPIVARPPSTTYRLQKFVKKNRREIIAVAVVIAIVFVAIFGTFSFANQIAQKQKNSAEASRLVERLLDADSSRIDLVIGDLKPYREWANPQLAEIFREADNSSTAKLRAGLGLLTYDDSVLNFLGERLLTLPPQEFVHASELLHSQRESFLVEYWRIVESESPHSQRWFHAACALARFDPDNANWQEVELVDSLARKLVNELPLNFTLWQKALGNIKHKLIAPLTAIYRDQSLDRQVRAFAADALGEYLSTDPEHLFALLVDAEDWQFRSFYHRISIHSEKAIELAATEINRNWPDNATTDDKELFALRQTNAAALLYKLGEPDRVWPLLKFSSDPRIRTSIIHGLRPRECEPSPIIERYANESDVSVRRALLMCLGEFDLPDRSKNSILADIRTDFRSANDAGLHAAAEWLLRKWKLPLPKLQQGIPELTQQQRLQIDKLKSSIDQVRVEMASCQSAWERELVAEDKSVDDELIDGLLVQWPRKTVPSDENARSDRDDQFEGGQDSENLTWVPGVVGKAASFNGKPADVPLSAAYVFDRKNDFSCSCWFRMNLGASRGAILAKYDNNLQRGFGIHLDPSNKQILCEWMHQYPDNGMIVSGQLDAFDDRWHHLCITYDGSSLPSGIKVFLDGHPIHLRVELDGLSETIKVAKSILAGSRDMAYPFRGQLNDMRIYNHEFEPEEVKLLFRFGLQSVAHIPPASRTQEQQSLLDAAHAEWDDSLTELKQQLRSCEQAIRNVHAAGNRNWYVNSQGQTFVMLNAGEFQMGSSESEADRGPYETLHRRSINRLFSIASKEVSNHQWAAFEKSIGRILISADKELVALMADRDAPQIAISWYDAARYCNWLSEQEGIPEDQWCYEPIAGNYYGEGMRPSPNYLELTGYRLPTEAEWEFACRAGTTTSRYFGDSVSFLKEYAWAQGSAGGRVSPIGQLKPNDFGLFDMLGNVSEWCHERSDRFYPDGESLELIEDVEDPLVLDNDISRRYRGYSCSQSAIHLRSAKRGNASPADRKLSHGVRPARTIR